MRIPLAGNISTKDGATNKNSRLYNVLAETRKDGKVVAGVRPGLNTVATGSGNGNSLVCFGGSLINIYGNTVFEAEAVAFDLLETATLPNGGGWRFSTDGVGICGIYYTGINPAPSIYSSDDGANWTTGGALPFISGGASWIKPAWNGSLFCTLTKGPNAAISVDGINWSSTIPPNANWRAIEYGNGIFCAISTSSNTAAISVNGIDWTQTTLPASQAWTDISFNGEIFCVIAAGSTICAVSSDGVNWTTGTMISAGGWWSIASSGNEFVAITASSTSTAYSPDGLTWVTGGNMPYTGDWNNLIWAGDRYVAVGSYNAHPCAESTDGISWTSIGISSAYYTFDGVSLDEGIVILSPASSSPNNDKGIKITFDQYTLTSIGSVTDNNFDFALIP